VNPIRWIVVIYLFTIAVFGGEPFALRGYYLTFMRMPVM